MSDGRVSNVRMGHAGGINFQPFLPCARSAWAIQGITRRSSSSSQHRECLESLARTPRNYTSEWKCGVVGGPGCSGWEVRRVRGWAGWLTFHNARFYAHHAAPVGQGGHEGFVSHLIIHHTYKWVSEWVSELECSVRHKQTTALCPHSAHALTSSS